MLAQALILTAFIVVVLTTLSFLVSRSVVERAVQSQLSSVASIAEDSLEQTLQSHHERVSLLLAHADVQSILSGQSGTATLQRLLVQLQRDESSIRSMEVRDRMGGLLARAGDEIGLPDAARQTPYRHPIIGVHGWTAYDVISPIWSGTQRVGYLAVRYDAQPILAPLIAVAPTIGDTAEVAIVRGSGSELELHHLSSDFNESYVLSIASNDGQQTQRWMSVLNGVEDVSVQTDYRGRDSLIVTRYLPTLGWGLLFQVEQDDALEDIRTLALVHASIGTVLLFLAALLAWLLARQLTEPLRTLTTRVRKLGPNHWTIGRSVRSGDEVEVLEHVVVDMAGRLKRVYDNQEEIIDERTKELKRQYALDRSILESIEYGVVTVDQRGIITGINPAGLRLLAVLEVDVVGKPAAQIIRIFGHKGDALAGVHPLMKALRSGLPNRSPANAHYNVLRADDQLMPVLYSVTPLKTAGKVFGGIMVFQDITEERKIDYLKSEFISLASHQLRTPLSALRWYTELMAEKQKSMDSEQRGYLQEMKKSVERMVRLLASLLNASRMDSGNLRPELKDVDMHTIVRELHEDIEATARETGVKLKMVVPRSRIRLKTDQTLLRIVLQNLVGNAIKYSQATSGKTVIVTLASTRGGVRIAVADEGMGVPRNEQQRVFQKFFRASNVRKVDTDGNGLGLYISKTIVDRLGGTISFTSQENKGSVFTVTFPKANTKKAA